ncbi:MAG TPA: 1-acyl-sn-glycerol-3-phosphate acyltransferase [Candidatus Limnocylindria bacterium]|nr:1-acyl-sn-glycerol-3-phosphate acyltransferase [Candidatus Limnocylindria bacterium]
MLDGERGGGGTAPLAAHLAAVGRDELMKRLAALETQVEAALGRHDDSRAARLVWQSVEGALHAYAQVRRWFNWDTLVPSGQPLSALSLLALYRYWWRVEAIGLERIPASGPVVLVANRAGTPLPYDAFMLAVALAVDHPSGRRARPLVERWMLRMPVVGSALAALGTEPATAARLRRLLAAGEAAIIFPESRDALGRPFDRRYRLARFGHTPLLRTAVEAGATIVPVAVVGSEEAQPVFRLERPARVLGLPSIPLTPTLVPLPTKWRLHVGVPLETGGRQAPAPAEAARQVVQLAAQLRERLQGLVSEAVGRRRGLFT